MLVGAPARQALEWPCWYFCRDFPQALQACLPNGLHSQQLSTCSVTEVIPGYLQKSAWLWGCPFPAITRLMSTDASMWQLYEALEHFRSWYFLSCCAGTVSFIYLFIYLFFCLSAWFCLKMSLKEIYLLITLLCFYYTVYFRNYQMWIKYVL